MGGMPRKPRQERAGGIFHVFARGVDRRRIFLDDDDRRLYLHLLGGVSRRQGWSCLAYCLMTNHVHVLVQTHEPNLGAGMRRLHGTYAQAFNERYARTGHLFERRFNDRPVTTIRSIAVVSAYIAANPVAAGLAPTPDAFGWSSHATIAAGTAPSWLDVDQLEALLSSEGGSGTERYLAALAARMETIGDASQREAEDGGWAALGDWEVGAGGSEGVAPGDWDDGRAAATGLRRATRRTGPATATGPLRRPGGRRGPRQRRGGGRGRGGDRRRARRDAPRPTPPAPAGPRPATRAPPG